MGAIILKHDGPSDPSAGVLEEFLILDGQQRIATLYLTLLAIALEWQQQGFPNNATAIAETFLKSVRTTTKGKPRFFPTIPDTPEFVSLCRRLKADWDVPTGGNFRAGRMSAALDRAQSEVRLRCETDAGFDGEALRALERTLVDKVEVAAINIAERHQPNEVFDRLNRKGQSLTVGDLVKNEIFRRLATDASAAMKLYGEHWEPFEKSFSDPKQLDDYYYPFTLTVNEGSTVAGSFQVLNDHWNKMTKEVSDSTKAAELIIDHLGSFVPEYNALSAGSRYQSTKEITDIVKRLSRMPVPRVTYSFLIQILRAHRIGELDSKAAAECLRIVEAFLVRRAFSGLEPTGLHAVFKGSLAKNGGKPESLVADLRTRTIEFPDDDQVRADILNKPFYGRRLDGYVLAELEIESHRTNPLTDEQLVAITVDHLAPQSLKGSWSEVFPDNNDERQRLLGLLGNLVPLSQSDNSTKGSSDWMEAAVAYRMRPSTELPETFLTNIRLGGRKKL